VSALTVVAMSILAGVIALCLVGAFSWAVERMTDGAILPPAQPGRWFGEYRDAWERDHPGAWERGEEKSGSFYLARDGGDSWGSSTLEWDLEWFRSKGMAMPEQYFHVTPKPPGPNEFRVGRLGPGESVSFPVRIEGGE
jgi:hypothetical protein